MSKVEEDFRKDFHRYSEKFRKKHGQWAIFRFGKEGTFLSMDTWNGALYYCVGSGNYSYWNGFHGDSVFYFGSSGGWRDKKTYQPENVIKYYHEKMLKEVTTK